MAMSIERVCATPEAVAFIDELRRRHGPLMFFQSGGCCDGSAPMCYPMGEFGLSDTNVYLGSPAGRRSTWEWSSSPIGRIRS